MLIKYPIEKSRTYDENGTLCVKWEVGTLDTEKEARDKWERLHALKEKAKIAKIVDLDALDDYCRNKGCQECRFYTNEQCDLLTLFSR